MPYFKYRPKKWSVWNYIPQLTLPNEQHLSEFVRQFPIHSIIVDVGSGGRVISPNVITFDKYITAGTDVIGDIHSMPFETESVDGVICTATLEHIENPWVAAKEFYRILKPGGKVYIVTPFMQGYHPDPDDYWRFTEKGLVKLFENFKRLDSGTSHGSGSGVSWALIDFFRAFSDNRYISELLGITARFIFFWIKYFDIYLGRKKNNNLFASCYYFIGQKL
jgi:SAM-dependent methyltransferase